MQILPMALSRALPPGMLNVMRMVPCCSWPLRGHWPTGSLSTRIWPGGESPEIELGGDVGAKAVSTRMAYHEVKAQLRLIVGIHLFEIQQVKYIVYTYQNSLVCQCLPVMTPYCCEHVGHLLLRMSHGLMHSWWK